MQMILSIAVVVQIISAVAVIILVLLQHGKGAGREPPVPFSEPPDRRTFCRVRQPLPQRFSFVQLWPLRWVPGHTKRMCARMLRACSVR